MNRSILLVEDDPTSCAFLRAATERLPATVQTAGSIAEAIALAASASYALWLIDANLPDGNGISLLQALRAKGLSTPAIAHTASRDPAEHDALRAAGFLATIAKPLSAEAWVAEIRGALGDPPPDASMAVDADDGRADAGIAQAPVWDDAAALAALGGSAANVAALRGLFLAELPAVREAVASASRAGDAASVAAVLHRLRASCGFVGAARMEAAVIHLHRQPLSKAALATFLAAAQATLSPG